MGRKKILSINIFILSLILLMPLSGIAKKDAGKPDKNESDEGYITVYQNIDIGANLQGIILKEAEYDLYCLVLELFEGLQDLGLQQVESGEIVLSQEDMESIVLDLLKTEQFGLIGYPENELINIEEIEEEKLLFKQLPLKVEQEEENYPTKIGDESIFNWFLINLREFPGNILEIIAGADIPRFGYINGIADFYVLQGQLIDNINYNLSPNVTWVEVIEETAAWFGKVVDVNDFVYVTLNDFLVDKISNRTFTFQGLGIHENIYNTWIKPTLLNLTPELIDNVWDSLNEKVQWERGPINRMKDTFGNFLEGISTTNNKDQRRGLFAKFTKLIGSVVRLSVVGVAYLCYMNETQTEEYIQGIYNSVEDYVMVWNDFYLWLDDDPWLDPIAVNGTVNGTGFELEGFMVYLVDQYSPDNLQTFNFTNEEGHFKDLEFKTKYEKIFFGLHKCVTTAEKGEYSMTFGGLPDDTVEAWVVNRLLVGSFSGGSITCNFNFDEEIGEQSI